ncbi:hypothetical protein AAFF_G00205310 [Aldrovandia affinis]|uniref:Uncharacterized protein n=1 Tax=Aldrovandia affinis TaxID=143900 RepID=A0AAD7RHG4_9TELE|nr:hypothetical protein AAFF_G00205310 [Aldrovandia affinis]
MVSYMWHNAGSDTVNQRDEDEGKPTVYYRTSYGCALLRNGRNAAFDDERHLKNLYVSGTRALRLWPVLTQLPH